MRRRVAARVDTGIPEPWNTAGVHLSHSVRRRLAAVAAVGVGGGWRNLVGECGVHQARILVPLVVAEEPFERDAVCEVGDVQVAAAVGVVFVGGGG